MSEPHHIAIVGGGFSGSMTAINLARLSAAPLRVSVYNSRYPSGRGIAYGTRRIEHVLNVVARNMSAFPDHPGHFLEWLRTRIEYADTPDAELRETFVPRRIYGEYLRALGLQYTHRIDGRCPVAIEWIEGEVSDVTAATDSGWHIHSSAGGPRLADAVVLATGNEPPADLPGTSSLAEHPAYCANPWINWEGRLPSRGETVILLGTGLTTVDAILTLLALNWSGPIVAISRHGLLPESHFKGIDYPEFPPAGVELTTLGLDGLVQLIEQHCAELRRRAANPGIVVDKLRPFTQRLWQSFTDAERRSFVARYAAKWNVIRHRIAQPVHAQVTSALRSGALSISSDSIVRLDAVGQRVRVHLAGGQSIEGGLVINCTGPHTRFSAAQSPLLRTLLARGTATPDVMDMGVRVDGSFHVIGNDGQRARGLFALGPLLRGTLWESIAVPELRGQALHVAERILDDLKTRRTAIPVPRAAETAVMEYWI